MQVSTEYMKMKSLSSLWISTRFFVFCQSPALNTRYSLPFVSVGMFRNAEFHCRVRRYNYQLVGHRLTIRWVQNELACAIDCLIYGNGCESYNYKHNDLASNGQNLCELNSSNHRNNPASLVYSISFQYCERVS